MGGLAAVSMYAGLGSLCGGNHRLTPIGLTTVALPLLPPSFPLQTGTIDSLLLNAYPPFHALPSMQQIHEGGECPLASLPACPLFALALSLPCPCPVPAPALCLRMVAMLCGLGGRGYPAGC
jgi:hypothetical protein